MTKSMKVSSGVPLYEISGEVEKIIRVLEENDGELTPELEHLFDASSEALAVKLDSCLMALKNRGLMLDAIEAEINRLQEWMRLETQKTEWLRGYILNNMLRAGVEKSEGVHGRLTVAKGRESVQVDKMGDIPMRYMTKVPETYNANKKAIKEAIQRGEEVSGARIVTGSKTLRVK